ncbi:MAG: GFA family protein [Burkholderiales bacterium]
MLTATCHCGAVRVEVPRKPRTLTDCNCSICRRYGTLWAYYSADQVKLIAAPKATESYAWGRKALRFVRCTTCGCVMCWIRVEPRKVTYTGVNARNFEPSLMGTVRVRRLDGAHTWKYLD